MQLELSDRKRERRKSFFLFEREKRWPSGSLNCDDTIDGGVNDTLWFNGVEILVAGCFGTCVEATLADPPGNQQGGVIPV